MKKLIFILFIFLILVVIIYIVYLNIDFLNNNLNAIQVITTILLAIITAVYAYFTQRMANLMAKQVISDIKISNIILGTQFIEEWFLERLKENPEEIREYSSFKFKLLFDVYNKSSASGSIEKPILILKFNNDNFEYKVFPSTKEHIYEHEGDNRFSYNVKIKDLGGTILLNGGGFQKIELEYVLSDFSQELLVHIKESLNFLEYFIEFSDNLENRYKFKIEKIQPEKDTFRK